MDARGAIESLKLAAVVLAAVLAYRAYKAATVAAGGVVKSVSDSIAQATANAQSAVVNLFSATPEPGDKAFLYSDGSYSGLDTHTGLGVLEGARGNEDFRRHEYEQRAAGNAPAASSNAGAAFGIYAKPGRRRG